MLNRLRWTGLSLRDVIEDLLLECPEKTWREDAEGLAKAQSDKWHEDHQPNSEDHGTLGTDAKNFLAAAVNLRELLRGDLDRDPVRALENVIREFRKAYEAAFPQVLT